LPTFVERLDKRVHLTHDLGFLNAVEGIRCQDADNLTLRA